MGWSDVRERAGQRADTMQAEAVAERRGGMPDDAVTCPRPDLHYRTRVNKGSLNVDRWAGQLAKEYGEGYRLTHVLEQDGNTVMVFEHHWH
jgi:hypothetical protein